MGGKAILMTAARSLDLQQIVTGPNQSCLSKYCSFYSDFKELQFTASLSRKTFFVCSLQ